MNHRFTIFSIAIAAVVLMPTLVDAAPRGELVRISAPHEEVVWREAPRPYYGHVTPRRDVIRVNSRHDELLWREAPQPYYHDEGSLMRLAEFEDESQLIPAPESGVVPQYGGKHGKGGCCGCLVFVGGIESTFLFPILDDAPASVTLEENGGYVPTYATGEVELDDDIFFSPRIWGGLEYCGWGLIGRVWWAGDSDNVFAPDTPFLTQSYVAEARLQAFTADVELYKRWCTCWGGYRQFGVGFRYASLEADEFVEAHGQIGTDFVQGTAHTHRQFDGPGFTIGFAGTKCCDCACLSLFYGVRGSVMWGDIQKSAQTTAWAFDPGVVPGTANNFSTAVASTDDFGFIGEAQVGAQWEHPLACHCGRVFVRTALEYQFWSADAGDAATGSLAFTGGATVTSLATADDFNVHMIGVTVATGIIW